MKLSETRQLRCTNFDLEGNRVQVTVALLCFGITNEACTYNTYILTVSTDIFWY